MDDELDGLVTWLRNARYRCTSEAVLQRALATRLSQAGVPYRREVVLNPTDRLDFLVQDRVAIEVKIKGSRADLVRQLERYALVQTVGAIIVVTNQPRLASLPDQIHGKPVAVVTLLEGALM